MTISDVYFFSSQHKLNLNMKHFEFDTEEDCYWAQREPMRKQTEDEKPSKGKKPRKLDRQKARDRKRDFE